jgi:hypothetical protein
MKIKMGPDEADASSTREWATMSGWLAELREDDQAEPDSGGSAGTDSRGHDETESQSYTGMAIRSHTGTDNRGSTGTDNRGPTGTDNRPNTGTDGRPNTGTDNRANTGTDGRPYPRAYPRADNRTYTGTDNRPNTGTDNRPNTGTDGRPYPRADNPAYTPADNRTYTGTDNRTSTGTGSRSHVPSASEAGSRAVASAAAPPNTYARRRWAGPRATVNARAETFPVRPLIGDELRMPTTWCEMGSCISWHADRAALGEADNRARAISAGWRIDALGRITCPRCQQTSTSFRATQPVVPWDRATAIVMAARATARPGSRYTGSVPRPNGRGTRRPASGQR